MEKDYSGLLEMAGKDYQMSAYMGGASAFSQLMSGYMNYNALKTEASGLKVQASNIELQAQQRANMLREQFVQSVGAYQMNAAQRGISVGSGSVRSNMENSSVALGKDISTIKKSSQLQANALRGQASIMKMRAKSALGQGITNSLVSLAGAGYNYSQGSQLLQKAGK